MILYKAQNVDFDSDLNVDGNAQIDGTLTVDSATTIKDNVIVRGSTKTLKLQNGSNQDKITFTQQVVMQRSLVYLHLVLLELQTIQLSVAHLESQVKSLVT